MRKEWRVEMPFQRRLPSKVYALDADKMKFRYTTKDRVGGNGFGLSDEGCMYTLNTIDQHMVAVIYGQARNGSGSRAEGVRQGGKGLRERRSQ